MLMKCFPAGRATKSVLAVSLMLLGSCVAQPARADDSLRISTFSSDITIPIGHRCMGVLKTKANQIDDPLEAHGLVIQGAGPALVLVALDWCEVRNGAYEQWRDALAKAAGTLPRRVLLCCLHQHDAPVTDSGAQAYLDAHDLQGELYDVEFQQDCIRVVAAALSDSLAKAKPLTHLAFAESEVQQIASNRRVVHPDGSIRFDRYSRASRDSYQAQADAGEIDPLLKSIVFFSHDEPQVVLSCYATHPMSAYGQGAVSGDFVALARRRLQSESPGVKQIYVSGCSGDVTAGKYNDGSPGMRGILADRLYQAMKQAMETAMRPEDRIAISKQSIQFRHAELRFPFHDGTEFQRDQLQQTLADSERSVEDRITAAMSLSSLDRVERDSPIDLPCLDFGNVKLVLLPGEAFVRYQRMAQQIGSPAKVMAIGYGECWPGYIPTDQAFREGFDHGWRWVAAGCETILREQLTAVLQPSPADERQPSAIQP